MNYSNNNYAETKLMHNIEESYSEIDQKIHWFITLLNFLKH